MKKLIKLFSWTLGGLLCNTMAYAQDALFIDTSGNVGIGTSAPSTKLHVEDGDFLVSQSSVDAKLRFEAGANAWNIRQDVVTGRLVFLADGGGAATGSFKFDPAGQENLLRVGVTAPDAVDITGRLIINGSEVIPDYVFAPDYPRRSIEEHAKFMWQNQHLPALPSAGPDGKAPVDVLSHQLGILKELEMAHIYIDELNKEISTLQNEMASEIESLKRELAELREAE